MTLEDAIDIIATERNYCSTGTRAVWWVGETA